MHVYLRIILENPETYTVTEEQRLRETITNAPGVDRVKEIKRHPKGGYAVMVEGSGDNAELMVSYLQSSGYRLAF